MLTDDSALSGQSLEQDPSQYTKTVMAIAFDFDYVTNSPDKSRADEIRILTIKNKKQPKKSKEKKPPGVGCPAGGVESGEDLICAVIRETLGESGYGGAGAKVLGELFYEHRHRISNSVHVFLLEVDSSYAVQIRERDEVDQTWDNWITLRQLLQMQYAINKDGTPKDPNGVYYSHIRRVVKALNILIFSDPESLQKDVDIWADEHYDDIFSAINDLLKDGLVSISREGLITLPQKEY